ncbi:uncharacterized protein LOC143906719 [Temnothorax americanus]|uniref:uncharacterized protein LOC143906719 n=1 Tax=Temnothorax americanus TaxID=1964332 RepID=UPI004069921C
MAIQLLHSKRYRQLVKIYKYVASGVSVERTHSDLKLLIHLDTKNYEAHYVDLVVGNLGHVNIEFEVLLHLDTENYGAHYVDLVIGNLGYLNIEFKVRSGMTVRVKQYARGSTTYLTSYIRANHSASPYFQGPP